MRRRLWPQIYDRAFAIDGLRARILNTLNSKGGFGVLDPGTREKGLLRRSLLWHRSDKSLPFGPIDFPADRSPVPSWSWMACLGGIDYFNPGFGNVEWHDLQSPWSGGEKGVHPEMQEDSIALVASVREYDTASTRYAGDIKLVFDKPWVSEQLRPLCVVLGKEIVEDSWQRYYVILVQETESRDQHGRKIYESRGWIFVSGVYWEYRRQGCHSLTALAGSPRADHTASTAGPLYHGFSHFLFFFSYFFAMKRPVLGVC